MKLGIKFFLPLLAVLCLAAPAVSLGQDVPPDSWYGIYISKIEIHDYDTVKVTLENSNSYAKGLRDWSVRLSRYGDSVGSVDLSRIKGGDSRTFSIDWNGDEFNQIQLITAGGDLVGSAVPGGMVWEPDAYARIEKQDNGNWEWVIHPPRN
jgi:hypothetical protein